jgi:two-component system LytT family response regulator
MNMNWLLVINDSKCKRELDVFLKKHSSSVVIKSEVGKMVDELNKTLLDIRRLTGNSAKISINAASNVIILKVDDIVHCQSSRSYTQVHLSNGTEMTVTKTLKQFEKDLGAYQFVRIHQSHLVNLNYVSRFNKSKRGSVVLNNGTELPVAIRKKEQLLKNFK